MQIYHNRADLKKNIDYTAVMRHLFKESLYNVAYKLCGYKDINKLTHGEIIKTLESDGKRKLIVCPRGAFKSSLCVVSYAIWRMIRNPNIRIMIDSENYTNSKNFLQEIQAHLESRLCIAVFGKSKKNRMKWNEGAITIAQRTKVLKEPTIQCSGIGAQKTGQHYDLIIADDLNSVKNSHTPELSEKVVRHFKMYSSLLEPDGTIVVVGTRYSANDVIQFIINNELTDDQQSMLPLSVRRKHRDDSK